MRVHSEMLVLQTELLYRSFYRQIRRKLERSSNILPCAQYSFIFPYRRHISNHPLEQVIICFLDHSSHSNPKICKFKFPNFFLNKTYITSLPVFPTDVLFQNDKDYLLLIERIMEIADK